MNWSQIEFFYSREFECKCGCGLCHMDFEFVNRLDMARRECNVPFVVTSGYRCPSHNNTVSRSGFAGPHTTGKAADIQLYGTHLRESLSILSDLFERIGFAQKGSLETRFIHLDNLVGPEYGPIWTY